MLCLGGTRYEQVADQREQRSCSFTTVRGEQAIERTEKLFLHYCQRGEQARESREDVLSLLSEVSRPERAEKLFLHYRQR